MKRTEIDRKFDEIVDFAEIEKFIDTPVKHYPSIWLRASSSGMYVRLAFAGAAHRSAEPFGCAQDRRSRRSLEPEVLLVGYVGKTSKSVGG